MANKNEAKIRFTAETSGFNDEIKKSNQTMAELRAEMKLNEEQMKTNGTTVEGLQKKQKLLDEQLSVSKSKTEALSQKVEKAVEIYGENSDEVSKLRIQLMNAQSAEEKIQQQIQNCNKALEAHADSANEAEEAHESLADKLKRQQDELSDLKSEYAEAVVQYGKNSREAKGLAKEIKSLSSEVKDNQFAMNRAEEAADGLDRSIEDVGDSAKEAESGFTVMKGALANLVSSGIQSAISGIGNLASTFLGLSEETKELQTQFSLLEGSFDTAGFSAETAKDTLYDLQGVLGDTDRATEASNLLAKMSESQADLETNTRILTGVFAEYGNSIPTEGLAEAMAATSAMGSVQGVLADALEWQGINLDSFNEKLGKLKTEEERAALIQETLTGLYGESADAYLENNAALIESNKGQLAYNESLAELGKKSAPITNALRDGFTQILDSVNGLLDGADFEAISSAISGAFSWFVDEGIPKIVEGFQSFVGWMKDAVTWARENEGVLIAVGAAIGVVATAIGLYNTVNAIKAAMDAAQVTTIWGLVSAHIAQAAAAMAAIAPYVLIVAAIAAVIAIIVLCIKYWDEIVAAVEKCWDAIMATLSQWGQWIYDNVIAPIGEFFSGLWGDIKGFASSAWDWIVGVWTAASTWFNTKIVQPIANFFTGMWDGLKNGAKNAWQGVKDTFSAVASFFKNIFSNAWEGVKKVFSTGGKIFEGIKEGISSVFKTVVNAIIKGINKIVAVPFNAINGMLNKVRSVEVAGISPFKSLWKKNPLTVPEIPLLAKGGILTKPTLNIAGEAGPEAIIPIDKLEWFISGAVEKAMNTSSIQTLAYAIADLADRPVNLNVNGRTYAQAIANDSDSVNGVRNALVLRGLAL